MDNLTYNVKPGKPVIVFNKPSAVIKFVRSFGESMAIEHGSSLIAGDAHIDADTLSQWALKQQIDGPLKIYFREHGTFTNFAQQTQHLIEFWEKELLGVLNIEVVKVDKKTQYNVYYEKYIKQI